MIWGFRLQIADSHDPQRGLGRNQILAPEEPNVYSTAINRTTRAPAERNVSGDDCPSRASFAPSGARRILLQSLVI